MKVQQCNIMARAANTIFSLPITANKKVKEFVLHECLDSVMTERERESER